MAMLFEVEHTIWILIQRQKMIYLSYLNSKIIIMMPYIPMWFVENVF